MSHNLNQHSVTCHPSAGTTPRQEYQRAPRETGDRKYHNTSTCISLLTRRILYRGSQASLALSARPPPERKGDGAPDGTPSHYLLPEAAAKQGMQVVRAVSPLWTALVNCG
ncbi:hypothetical protein EYF80_032515 [Liparis tanakae]|uniref:Uncharacterized protein n=1 Tax=Liparis tanakae TaxID=230148 RepID=A0A4Z2GUQ7_9TELE|nr:hypothetical protein EYF80_032515 [Liparis tanakae]